MLYGELFASCGIAKKKTIFTMLYAQVGLVFAIPLTTPPLLSMAFENYAQNMISELRLIQRALGRASFPNASKNTNANSFFYLLVFFFVYSIDFRTRKRSETEGSALEEYFTVKLSYTSDTSRIQTHTRPLRTIRGFE